MPELPEVHTTATGLRQTIIGLVIKDVWTDYNSSFHKGKDNIKDPNFFKLFKKKVIGSTIIDVSRKGKNILVHLKNGDAILIHMKMTGHIMVGKYGKRLKKEKVLHESWEKETWVPKENREALWDPFNRFIHFVIHLSNGSSVVLSDVRRFAKVTLISKDNLKTSPHLASLGPEPLEENFSFKDFSERIKTKPLGKIKQVLMNPEIIAGIGNIYSDEALFRAGIHPLTKAGTIKKGGLQKLFKATQEVLSKGIFFGGDSESDYRNILGERGKFQERHYVYRRTKEKCRKAHCHGTVERIKIGGRSAHFCPLCQPLI